MGITWLFPPFVGGFFMAVEPPQQRSDTSPYRLTRSVQPHLNQENRPFFSATSQEQV